MRSTRIRLQLAALLFILLPASAGIVAVHASATCERFVRTYITKPVRNRVSKTTADAWAAWRVAHPNWKPNPNLHRPKYVMTRDEQVKKVDFACSIPETPSVITTLFHPERIDPPPVVTLPGMSTQVEFPTVPTEVAEITPLPPIATIISPPDVLPPTVSTPVPLPTPEPPGLLLAATGMAGLWLATGRRGLSA